MNYQNCQRNDSMPCDKKVNIQTVEFKSCMIEKLRDANALWRFAINSITSLADSLVGEKPLCTEALGLNPEIHRRVRIFTNIAGLTHYIDYLDDIMGTLDGEVLPTFNHDAIQPAIFYRVDSGRAEIYLKKVPGGWVIGGKATFLKPRAAIKNLRQKEKFDIKVAL